MSSLTPADYYPTYPPNALYNQSYGPVLVENPSFTSTSTFTTNTIPTGNYPYVSTGPGTYALQTNNSYYDPNLPIVFSAATGTLPFSSYSTDFVSPPSHTFSALNSPSYASGTTVGYAAGTNYPYNSVTYTAGPSVSGWILNPNFDPNSVVQFIAAGSSALPYLSYNGAYPSSSAGLLDLTVPYDAGVTVQAQGAMKTYELYNVFLQSDGTSKDITEVIFDQTDTVLSARIINNNNQQDISGNASATNEDNRAATVVLSAKNPNLPVFMESTGGNYENESSIVLDAQYIQLGGGGATYVNLQGTGGAPTVVDFSGANIVGFSPTLTTDFVRAENIFSTGLASNGDGIVNDIAYGAGTTSNLTTGPYNLNAAIYQDGEISSFYPAINPNNAITQTPVIDLNPNSGAPIFNLTGQTGSNQGATQTIAQDGNGTATSTVGNGTNGSSVQTTSTNSASTVTVAGPDNTVSLNGSQTGATSTINVTSGNGDGASGTSEININGSVETPGAQTIASQSIPGTSAIFLVGDLTSQCDSESIVGAGIELNVTPTDSDIYIVGPAVSECLIAATGDASFRVDSVNGTSTATIGDGANNITTITSSPSKNYIVVNGNNASQYVQVGNADGGTPTPGSGSGEGVIAYASGQLDVNSDNSAATVLATGNGTGGSNVEALSTAGGSSNLQAISTGSGAAALNVQINNSTSSANASGTITTNGIGSASLTVSQTNTAATTDVNGTITNAGEGNASFTVSQTNSAGGSATLELSTTATIPTLATSMTTSTPVSTLVFDGQDGTDKQVRLALVQQGSTPYYTIAVQYLSGGNWLNATEIGNINF